MEHYYRKYGDLKSMIQDLNASIRRLRSYLSIETKEKITEIKESTTITSFDNIIISIEARSELKLADPISTGRVDVTTVDQAIKQCSNIEQCARIERAWRDCRDNCLDVKDTIDAMISAINSLPKDIDGNNTNFGYLVQIFNLTRDCGASPLSTEKLKTIYEDTINESYKTSCIESSPCCIIICLISVILFLFGVSLFSCKGNENKTNNCIELCQCEKTNSLINFKTVVSINNKDYNVYLCKPFDTVFSRIDTISIAKIDNACVDNMLHLILYNDTTTALDTSFSLTTGFHYKCKNSPANRIRIIPTIKPEEVNLCKKDDCPPCSHYLYKIVMFALLIIALILVLLILRPILQRNTEYHNKANEKILDERLKVQNDWQEILQAKYRLDIRREELKLSIMEKKKKSDIDDDVRASEHQRHMEVLKAEQDHEYKKALLEQNNRSNQNDEQRIRDLNEQIIKLLNSLTTKKY